MFKSYFIGFICLISLSISLSAGNGFTEIDSEAEWQAILKTAKNNQKLILVDLYTSWCGYCKKMDKEVFADKSFQEELTVHYIPVKLNAETEFGYGFASRNGVQGYPTFVFFNGEGNSVGKVEGYEPLKKFRKSTERIYQSATKSKTYAKRFKKGKLSNPEMAQYYTMAKNANERAKIYEELMKLSDEELLSEPYGNFLKASAMSLDLRTTKLILQNKSKFIEVFGEREYTVTLSQLFNNTLLSAIENNNQELLTRMEQELLPNFIDDPAQLPDAIMVMHKLFYSGRSDWTGYQELMENYWQDNMDRDHIYDESYQLIQEFSHDKGALQLASTWMTEHIQTVPSFDNYLLLTIIEAVREEKDLAMQYANKASEVASSEEEKAKVKELKQRLEK